MEISDIIYIASLLGAGVLVFKAGGWKHDIDRDISSLKKSMAAVHVRLERVEKNLANLSDVVARLSGVVDRLAGDVARLSGVVDRLAGDVARLSNDMDRISNRVDNLYKMIQTQGLAGARSPLSLNDIGRKLAEEIKADSLVRIYEKEAFARTQGMNAYNIQEFCLDFAASKEDDLRREHPAKYELLSQVAYNNGEHIERLLGVVVGIKLRDKVLQMHDQAQAEKGAQAPPAALLSGGGNT